MTTDRDLVAGRHIDPEETDTGELDGAFNVLATEAASQLLALLGNPLTGAKRAEVATGMARGVEFRNYVLATLNAIDEIRRRRAYPRPKPQADRRAIIYLDRDHEVLIRLREE